MSGTKDGLYDKYRVTRRDDPDGKHAECEYFVLDPAHDPVAFDALAVYADIARDYGRLALADEIDALLQRQEGKS